MSEYYDKSIQHDEYSGTEIERKLESLLMCSVSERYVLAYKLGIQDSVIRGIDLNGPPSLVAHELIAAILRRTERNIVSPEDTVLYPVILRIISEELPAGIWDPLKRD